MPGRLGFCGPLVKDERELDNLRGVARRPEAERPLGWHGVGERAGAVLIGLSQALGFKEPRARCLLEDRVSEGKRTSEREARAHPGQERTAEGLTAFLSRFFSLALFPFIYIYISHTRTNRDRKTGSPKVPSHLR